MAFDWQRYKDGGGRLDLSGLDLERACRARPLPPELVRCIRYMHDVEHHTACYLRNLLNTRAHHDAEITAFLTLWAYEEYWHGEAWAAVLRGHGEPAGEARVSGMRRRLGWRITTSPLLWMAFSASTRHFLAVHMTFGVVNEWTTQAGYSRLAAHIDHDEVHELLRRIMRQEGRHIDFYLTQARTRLGDSEAAQRATRLLLRTAWSPVGSRVMPPAETAHLSRTLFADPDGREIAARVDRRIDALPGLVGLRLVDRALAHNAPNREPFALWRAGTPPITKGSGLGQPAGMVPSLPAS